METLVATVLLVVIFMMASMILNNLFSNTVKTNTREIHAHLLELEYLYTNGQLKLPYYADKGLWEVSMAIQNKPKQNTVVLEAIHKRSKQTIAKTINEN
jgi:hypothetical protein